MSDRSTGVNRLGSDGDQVEGPGKVAETVGVPETKGAQALCGNESVAGGIPPSAMATTVSLDHEAMFRTVEIRDLGSDGYLTAHLPAHEPTVPKGMLQFTLRRGHGLAQIAGPGPGRVGLLHLPPSPWPFPPQGRGLG